MLKTGFEALWLVSLALGRDDVVNASFFHLGSSPLVQITCDLGLRSLKDQVLIHMAE